MLDWHLERRKKLLLKFNISLARLWAELEEQSAAQLKARNGTDVISIPKAEIMREWPTNSLMANVHISNSKRYLVPDLATTQWLFLLKCLICRYVDLISGKEGIASIYNCFEGNEWFWSGAGGQIQGY